LQASAVNFSRRQQEYLTPTAEIPWPGLPGWHPPQRTLHGEARQIDPETAELPL